MSSSDMYGDTLGNISLGLIKRQKKLMRKRSLTLPAKHGKAKEEFFVKPGGGGDTKTNKQTNQQTRLVSLGF